MPRKAHFYGVITLVVLVICLVILSGNGEIQNTLSIGSVGSNWPSTSTVTQYRIAVSSPATSQVMTFEVTSSQVTGVMAGTIVQWEGSDGCTLVLTSDGSVYSLEGMPTPDGTNGPLGNWTGYRVSVTGYIDYTEYLGSCGFYNIHVIKVNAWESVTATSTTTSSYSSETLAGKCAVPVDCALPSSSDLNKWLGELLSWLQCRFWALFNPCA